MCTASGWPSVSGDALKTLAGKVSADFDFIDDAECDFETTAIEKIDEVPGTRGPKRVRTQTYLLMEQLMLLLGGAGGEEGLPCHCCFM
ncbi:hypothetical protein CK203_021741 [Vitis vinifera]|uniref:Uncharacterized protein n=1 Tax=Vitis vinifera TaxID=29760 RepID=A0A438J4Y9_VITVI|nr:hypothetical protein CK203_021741 [Vitis vinifera]